MDSIIVRKQKAALRCETAAWQKAALGIFALSLAVNLAQTARISHLEYAVRETAVHLEQAENAKDYAIEQLGAVVLQAERDKQARAEQAAAFEAAGAYTYIGECIITAYCPCGDCCGQWADGVTATGLPAGPGIVAVDKNVIPLGSVVIIDGQKYLAADTGVNGLHVDVCMASHRETVEHGARTADVWVVDQ